MANYLDGSLKHTRRILGIHVRGRKNKQSTCVGAQLKGSKPGTRAAARANLSKAAKQCGKS